MVRTFTQNGHQVIATGHRKNRPDQLAVELCAAVILIVMNVTDKHSISSALASLLDNPIYLTIKTLNHQSLKTVLIFIA